MPKHEDFRPFADRTSEERDWLIHAQASILRTCQTMGLIYRADQNLIWDDIEKRLRADVDSLMVMMMGGVPSSLVDGADKLLSDFLEETLQNVREDLKM